MAPKNERKKTPNFFEEDALDPIAAATKPATPKRNTEVGGSIEPQKRRTVKPVEKKKKVGYYFKPSNISRLEDAFLQIQLEKKWKGKISEFMEAILEHGLIDLESGNSQILSALKDQRKG